MRGRLAECLAILVATVLVGCATDSDPTTGDEPPTTVEASEADRTPTEVGGATTTPEPSPTAEYGSHENPADIGAEAAMSEWTVTITDVDTDATDRILDAHEWNDPPEPGHQYVLWEVGATYTGDESGTIHPSVSWAVVGGKGNTFDFGDRCGIPPDPLVSTSETFPGGSVSGTVCVSVPSDQMEGATIMVEEAFTYRGFYKVP